MRFPRVLCLLLALCVPVVGQEPFKFRGPVAVHPTNKRYFQIGDRAVYLAGHQMFNDIQDNAWRGQKTEPVAIDWPKHLDFMKKRGFNYLRNWITFSTGDGPKNVAGPMPFKRTGPGTALDGLPKFDLTRFDDAYFRRMHDRFKAAQDRGIVVSIMLFDVYGFNTHKEPGVWQGNVFNGKNNVHGLDVDTNLDQIGLEFFHGNDPKVREIQRAYVRKVLDTVNDLNNVIIEIANECSATQWQYDLIDFVHAYEKTKPKRHLVLMSPGGPDVVAKWTPHKESDLTKSKADVLAVLGDWGDYRNNPPANNDTRPRLLDRDHVDPDGSNDRVLPWKAVTRGYHYSLYDAPFEKSEKEDPSWDVTRRNIGATASYANRFHNLAAAEPRDALCSTGYCLADAGTNYLVFQPAKGDTFTVDLKPGRYDFEWYRPATAKVEGKGAVEAKGKHRFEPPFRDEAVLFLHRRGGGK